MLRPPRLLDVFDRPNSRSMLLGWYEGSASRGTGVLNDRRDDGVLIEALRIDGAPDGDFPYTSAAF